MSATAPNPPAAGTPATPPSPLRGRLFLVPAPLDHGATQPVPLEQVLPRATVETAARLVHWVCENARSARAVLKRIDALVPLAAPLQAQHIVELPRAAHKKGDHAGAAGAGYDATVLLAPALQGQDMGLLSEAGMPAVADPGSALVRAAHAAGIEVVPLVGPVSLLLALASSGLNGQNFAFVGYLPQDAAARETRIRELEGLALRSGQTQLFIETPYRNRALLQALLRSLKAETQLSVSAGLTLPTARTWSLRVAQWRQQPDAGPDERTPAVFAIGR